MTSGAIVASAAWILCHSYVAISERLLLSDVFVLALEYIKITVWSSVHGTSRLPSLILLAKIEDNSNYVILLHWWMFQFVIICFPPLNDNNTEPVPDIYHNLILDSASD